MGGCDLRSSRFLTPQALPVVSSGSQTLQFEAWSSFQGFDLLSAIFPLWSLMLSQPWATLAFAFFLPLWGEPILSFPVLEAICTPAGLWVLLEHQLVVECLWRAIRYCAESSNAVARGQEAHSPTLNACLFSL